jgi:hypothetical protein
MPGTKATRSSFGFRPAPTAMHAGGGKFPGAPGTVLQGTMGVGRISEVTGLVKDEVRLLTPAQVCGGVVVVEPADPASLSAEDLATYDHTSRIYITLPAAADLVSHIRGAVPGLCVHMHLMYPGWPAMSTRISVQGNTGTEGVPFVDTHGTGDTLSSIDPLLWGGTLELMLRLDSTTPGSEHVSVYPLAYSLRAFYRNATFDRGMGGFFSPPEV